MATQRGPRIVKCIGADNSYVYNTRHRELQATFGFSKGIFSMFTNSQAPIDGAETTDEALARAMFGIPVFPCMSVPGNKALDKTPTCEGGFKAASTDPQVVARMFANPQARLVGVPRAKRRASMF